MSKSKDQDPGDARQRPDLPPAADNIIEDLSGPEHGRPSAYKSRQRDKLEDVDLDLGEEAEEAPREPKVTPTPRESRVVEETMSRIEGQDLDTTIPQEAPSTQAMEADEPVSANEVEEKARREGGRPKSLKATDFEPLAWESSDTRLDREDEPAPLALSSCASSALGRLKEGLFNLNIFEKVSLAVVLVAGLIGLFSALGVVYSGPEDEAASGQSLAAIDLPVKGDLVTISEISAGWRHADGAKDVRPGYDMVPEVTLKTSGSGHLGIIFRNEQGTIAGDPFVVASGNQTVSCSVGYVYESELTEYQAGRRDAWSVQIIELKDPKMDLTQGKQLAKFDMPAERLASPEA